MIKLCFGTFTRALLLCGTKRLKKIELLNAMVQSVDNTCKLTSSAITGLLQCAVNLPDGRSNALGDVVSKALEIEPSKVAEYFSKKIIPLIDPNKRSLAVLALREMIAKDVTINGDTVVDPVSGTTKNTLLKQSKFVLADFLAGVFLYTTAIDNRIGKEAAKFVTDEFLQSFSDLERSISFSVPNTDKLGHMGKQPGGCPALDHTSLVDEVYRTYLSNAEEKYNQVKTLLYLNQPKPFYSLYVPNHVRHTLGRYNHNTISRITAKSLTDISNFIILDGSGGVGKTMMMRHMLLDAAAAYENFRHIPIFISLKDYDDSDLFDFIFGKAAIFSESMTRAMLRDSLGKGLVLLLFDGLDEINAERGSRFEKQLENFVDKYNKIRYVISSRPYQSFMSLSRFTVLRIEPFTQKQAIEFVNKIEFHPDEPKLKNGFIGLLESSLYSTHRSFIENPLLLTILLLTYEKFASIPTKQHIFYRKAFITLSETHDASKVSYKRHYKTGMIPEIIADYFAEFCFYSYKDSKLEFADEEFERYFDNLRINDKTTSAASFAYDLCTNLCLMFYEGKYQFTHRSFQEYFCALFFSKQNDKFLEQLGGFFEDRQQRGDQVFNMLYDMIPDKVEANIFIPFLQNLFDKCDTEDGYWTFLKIIHPCIRYTKGEVNEYPPNSPESFLFGFIIDLIRPDYSLVWDDLPEEDDFIADEYGHVQLDEHGRDLVRLENVHYEYPWLEETPEAVGWVYEFKVSEIHKSRFYEDVRDVLEKDEFVFKSEYTAVRRYFESIKARKQGLDDYFADLL